MARDVDVAARVEGDVVAALRLRSPEIGRVEQRRTVGALLGDEGVRHAAERAVGGIGGDRKIRGAGNACQPRIPVTSSATPFAPSLDVPPKTAGKSSAEPAAFSRVTNASLPSGVGRRRRVSSESPSSPCRRRQTRCLPH